MVKKELRMLIFPGTSLLVKPLPQRADTADPAPLNPGAAATTDPGVLEVCQASCQAAAQVAAEAAAAAGAVVEQQSALQPQLQLQQNVLLPMQQQQLAALQLPGLQGAVLPMIGIKAEPQSVVDGAVTQSAGLVLQSEGVCGGQDAAGPQATMPPGPSSSCEPAAGELQGAEAAGEAVPQLEAQEPVQQQAQQCDAAAAVLQQPHAEQQQADAVLQAAGQQQAGGSVLQAAGQQGSSHATGPPQQQQEGEGVKQEPQQQELAVKQPPEQQQQKEGGGQVQDLSVQQGGNVVDIQQPDPLLGSKEAANGITGAVDSADLQQSSPAVQHADPASASVREEQPSQQQEQQQEVKDESQQPTDGVEQQSAMQVNLEAEQSQQADATGCLHPVVV